MKNDRKQDDANGVVCTNGSVNPKSQPCGTCGKFTAYRDGRTGGLCASIVDEVAEHWTGCIRHAPNNGDQPRATNGKQK